jgi:hypothetical protein
MEKPILCLAALVSRLTGRASQTVLETTTQSGPSYVETQIFIVTLARTAKSWQE